MSTRKAPVVNISETVHRVVLMFIVIILGVILSYTTAEAGVKKVEKNPFSRGLQKRKSHTYSCKVLAEKHRSSSNIVVKTNTRRPKWR